MTLLEILTKETESLKNQYIDLTIKWSVKNYNTIMSRKSWKEEDWCKFFNLTPELKNPTIPNISFLGFPKGFYNTAKSKEYNKYKDEISKLSRITIEQYIENETKYALIHYENSILKLAEKIKSKELDVENIKVETAHIGVNINTTLTDGKKTVRAFTIIAEGLIQRPHYRYLIK